MFFIIPQLFSLTGTCIDSEIFMLPKFSIASKKKLYSMYFNVTFCSFLLLANLITSFFYYQMLEDAPQISKGVQLSVVQGYMSNFFRSLPWQLRLMLV